MHCGSLSMSLNPQLVVDLIYKHVDLNRALPPQMTRLVKLMYLSELEYYRRTGQRLTELDWKFYHYGPYPPSLMAMLGNPDVETVNWGSGKQSRQLVRDTDSFTTEPKAEHDVEAVISGVVAEWSDADLNALLDYVYFETEPMQKAKRGESLDFSVVQKPPRKLELRLDPSKVRNLRKQIADRARDYSSREAISVPDELFDNMQFWDEDISTSFPTGRCLIRVEDLVPEE